MRLMDTVEGSTDSIGELVSSKQPLGLNYLPLAMNPLRLYCVEPRTFGGQQTWHYPYPLAAGFDLAVVGVDPLSQLMALMRACVVPNKEQSLLAPPLELREAPREKLRSYSAHGAAIDEPQPGLSYPRQIHPVAGEGLGLRVVLCGLLLEQTRRSARLGPGVQTRSLKAGEPGLVLKSQDPLRMIRMNFGEPDQPVSSPFLRAYSGSGLSIQRLARSQSTPSLPSVARMVSPLTCLSVMPRSKLASAA